MFFLYYTISLSKRIDWQVLYFLHFLSWWICQARWNCFNCVTFFLSQNNLRNFCGVILLDKFWRKGTHFKSAWHVLVLFNHNFKHVVKKIVLNARFINFTSRFQVFLLAKFSFFNSFYLFYFCKSNWPYRCISTQFRLEITKRQTTYLYIPLLEVVRYTGFEFKKEAFK